MLTVDVRRQRECRKVDIDSIAYSNGKTGSPIRVGLHHLRQRLGMVIATIGEYLPRRMKRTVQREEQTPRSCWNRQALGPKGDSADAYEALHYCQKIGISGWLPQSRQAVARCSFPQCLQCPVFTVDSTQFEWSLERHQARNQLQLGRLITDQWAPLRDDRAHWIVAHSRDPLHFGVTRRPHLHHHIHGAPVDRIAGFPETKRANVDTDLGTFR